MELPNRDAYEAQFTKRMRGLSQRQEEEFLRLLGDPPDIGNVPASFWDKVEARNREELETALLLIFLAAAVFHGAERSSMETPAGAWASRQADLVARQFTQTSARMAEVLSRDIEIKLRGDGVTPDWLRERAATIFGEPRLQRLAINETTIAQTEGGEAGVRTSVGISDEDTWRTNPSLSRTGPCPVCAPLNGKKRPEWSADFPAGPPAHASCVCDIVYANLPEVRPVRRR